MFIQNLFKFFLIFYFINGLTMLDDVKNEFKIIELSRKIIERIEICNQKNPTDLKNQTITGNRSSIVASVDDVQCGFTKYADIIQIFDKKIQDDWPIPYSIAMILSFEAIKSKNSFGEIGDYISGGLNHRVQNENLTKIDWIVAVGTISSTYQLINRRKPVYLDFSISYLRIKIFGGIREEDHFYMAEDSMPRKKGFESSNFDSILYKAIENNDLILLDYILEKTELTFNHQFSDGKKLIHLAFELNKIDICEYLLDEIQFDANSKDSQDRTPLFYSIQNGSLHLIKYCHIKGCNVYQKNKYNGESAIHWATHENRLDVIKYLVDLGSRYINPRVKNFKGQTALDIAKENNNKEIINYLKFAPFKQEFEDQESNITAYVLEILNDDYDESIEGIKYPIDDKITAFKYLLDEDGKNISVDYRVGEKNYTFLHLAAKKKIFDLVKFFVEEKKMDLYAKRRSGATAFHDASFYGCMECVKFFVEKGMSANLRDNNEETPVMRSIYGNEFEIFKYLVNEADGDIYAVSKYKTFTLALASRFGCLDCARLIVEEKKFDIQTQVKGYDALSEAVQYKNLPVVEYLVKKGAILNRTYGDEKKTLLELAKDEDDNEEVINYLKNLFKKIKEKSKFNLESKFDLESKIELESNLIKEALKFDIETNLIKAIRDGNFTLLQNIIEIRNVSVNHKLSDMKTVLHHSAINKRLAFIRYLQEKGIDLETKDIFGMNALMYAVKSGCINCMKFLIEKGANSNAKDDENDNTLINYSIAEKQLSILKYLIDVAKADPNIENLNGQKSIHYAAGPADCLECLKFLIEDVKIYVDQNNSKNQTPLSEAIKYKRYENAKYLISKSANLTKVDQNDEFLLKIINELNGKEKTT